MIKNLYVAGTIGMILLGIAHSILAFKIHAEMNADFFWFIGTGLALIFVGLANYMNLRENTLITFRCSLIINVLTLFFASILAIKIIHIPAILVSIFSLLLLICSIVRRKGK